MTEMTLRDDSPLIRIRRPSPSHKHKVARRGTDTDLPPQAPSDSKGEQL
jgi:hypothetical protein